jgi:hypothetical protein
MLVGARGRKSQNRETSKLTRRVTTDRGNLFHEGLIYLQSFTILVERFFRQDSIAARDLALHTIDQILNFFGARA